ncbi:MAG: FAD-binding oxidoreductase [Candidatus Freyarchaeota archaeon]
MSVNHQLVYELLVEIVGPDYVSDDPAVLEAYSRTGWVLGRKKKRRPGFVVLPGSVEEVQAIVRTANEHKVPFIPVGSFLHWSCQASYPETIILDFKRMNRILKIDEKNKYAVIEPFVTYSQLQAEAMKRGLWLPVPSSGGNTSVLANHLFCGSHFAMHRIPYYARAVLGVEWVLPTGEILRLGSAGYGEDYFWGEGPGPDLRGLMRGYIGVLGGLGVVTKMAVRLYPWTGPKTFPCRGVFPNKVFDFPEDLAKLYLAIFSNTEDAVNAIYEICRAEIGMSLHLVSTAMAMAPMAKSREEFYQLCEAFKDVPEFLLFMSFKTSPRVMDYERKVLQKIVEENNGVLLPEEMVSGLQEGIPETIRSSVSMRIINPTGGYDVFRSWAESLDKLLDQLKEAKKFLTEKYGDFIHFYYMIPLELGHYGHIELSILYDPLTQLDRALECQDIGIRQDAEQKMYVTGSAGPAHEILGPAYGNYQSLLRKIKRKIDPNNVSNPPYPIDVGERGG